MYHPHAFGLADAELTKWQDLRAQKDAEYTKAWGKLINASSAWQAEYQTFFGEDAPTRAFESLSPEQQLNVIAAYIRVQNANGFAPFNISTDSINATIFGTGKMIGYRVNGHLIGFENAPIMTEADYQTMLKRPDFQVVSFGQSVTLPWNVQMNDLGVFARDIVGPVFVPGKAANEAMYLFVYVRDQNKIPYPAFVEFPFVQQTLENGGYFEHADNPYSRIEPGTLLNITFPVKLDSWLSGESRAETTLINSAENIAKFWLSLLTVKTKGGYVVLGYKAEYPGVTYPSFWGGIKLVNIITIEPRDN